MLDDARRRTRTLVVRADAQAVAAGERAAARAAPAAGWAFGVYADDLLGIAVAIELLHNGFLIHDDVADGSEMRRAADAACHPRRWGRNQCGDGWRS
jgi:geranylgeranyl pyrophosphate synthase